MRIPRTFEDSKFIFGQLWDELDKLRSTHLNMKGNRVTNLSDAVNNQDAVTLKQLKQSYLQVPTGKQEIITLGTLAPIVNNPPSVPPGPGKICTTPTNPANSVCYDPAVLGTRNLQSFYWFQNQIAVGAGNPWDFGCFSGLVFYWPQISQMLIVNGVATAPPSFPANYASFGFIGAGTPPYEPPGSVWFIHSLSICGGFDA